MTHICRHCSNRYETDSGVDGFCCVGCREVYAFIHEEGFDDYYRMQDRPAEPLKDRAFTLPDAEAIRQAQLRIKSHGGSSHAIFAVEGMSCMGCVWLIQRLALQQGGVLRADVSLTGNLLELEWKRGAFDLVVLAKDLLRFGYRLDPVPCRQSRPVSGVSIRLVLTAVFTLNAWLLLAYESTVGSAERMSGLLQLLRLVSLVFVLLLGAAPFCLSVIRAARIRRWHSDWIALAVVILAVASSVYAVQSGVLRYNLAVPSICVVVFVLILARWLEDWRTRRHG